MTAPRTGRPLDPARYQRMRAAGFTDDEIRADGFEIPNSGPGETFGKPNDRAPDNSRTQAVRSFGDRTLTGANEVLQGANEVLQGATLGWADEAVGLVSPSTRDAMRERSARFHAESPGWATTANIAGGLLTGGGLARLGAKLLPRVAGAGLKAAALRGAANAGEGAIAGAIGGAGAAQSPEGRLAGAATGAALGGAAGGAIPAAGGLLKGARRALLPFSAKGAANVADELIGEAIEDVGQIRLPVAGKPQQLVDRIGEPGRKLARGARTTSSKARQILANLSEQRMPGAGARVAADVRDALAIPHTTPPRAANAAARQRAQIAAVEFTPARMAAPVTSPTVAETLTASPIFADVFEQMRDAASVRPANHPNARQIAPLFGEQGLTRPPTVADIETIRQGLDDAIQSGRLQRRNPVTGRYQTTNVEGEMRRALQDTRSALMEDAGLNAEHAWYAPARGELAAQHQLEDAIPQGRALLDRGPMEVADLMQEAAPARQQGLRIGYAARADKQLADAAPLSASRIAGGGGGATAREGARARLNAVTTDDMARARLASRLGAEDDIAYTERFLTGQTETADKALEAAGIGAKALQRAAQMGRGGITSAVVPLLAVAQGNTGKVSKALAERLATLSPEQQQAYLRYIAQFMEDRAAQQAMRRQLARGAIGATGTTAGRNR